MVNSLVSITTTTTATSKAFRRPPTIIIPLQSSPRNSDYYSCGPPPSSSSSAVRNQLQSHSPSSRSISLNWWGVLGSSRSSVIAETQAENWVGAAATSLSRCCNIRTRGRSGRETSGVRRSSSFSWATGTAPELSSNSEKVMAGADGTREENGEERGTQRKLGAVFFDMDDTLVLTHEADSKAHLAVMALVAVRAPQVNQSAVLRDFLERFKYEAWDPEHKVEVNEWRARLWGMALEGEGVDDMDLARDLQNCFDRERLQGFRWTTGVEWLVRTLHRQGIKVGIITNGHAMEEAIELKIGDVWQVQRAKLKACNAEELFDTILVGGEEPDMKPHRDIFIKACNLAGCKPEESVMVGDTLKTDIQGGINAGFLSTVWVNVHKREPRPGSAKPDHEITTFIELQHVLEQYGVVFETSE